MASTVKHDRCYPHFWVVRILVPYPGGDSSEDVEFGQAGRLGTPFVVVVGGGSFVGLVGSGRRDDRSGQRVPFIGEHVAQQNAHGPGALLLRSRCGKFRASIITPLTAAAAAIEGLVRCVRPQLPCLPSKFLLEIY